MIKKNNDKLRKKISKNKFKKKINDIFNKFITFIVNHYTISFKILIAYILFVLIGAGLLFLPISFNEQFLYKKSNGSEFHFLDSIFISSSAFSNTGLTITDVSKTFSIFGQVIIYIWIQLGGFGLLSTFYLIGKSINKISNKKILSSSIISYAERGGTKISNTGVILFSIFLINILIQTIFSIIFTIIFHNIKFNEVIISNSGAWVETEKILPMYNNLGSSIWNAIFITGSSINNAGFDLFGSTSLAPFRNDIGILVQFLSMFLFIFGGIGYIVIYDIWKKIEYFIFKQNPKFFSKFFKINSDFYKYEKPEISIFSKICLWSTLVFGILSISIVFLIEYISIQLDNSLLGSGNYNYFNNNLFNSNWSIIFNTLSTRSAGFATIDMNIINGITKWIFIFLMFIGTSPSSTGGGIRTTTFVVLMKSIWAKIIGVKDITIFKKRISKRTVVDSTNIFSLSIVLITILTIIIGVTSMKNDKLKGQDMTNLFFEASSAFGTTGLSLNVTGNLDTYAYIPLIVLMFFGQLGIVNSIQMFAIPNKKEQSISYQDIEIKLG